MARPRNNGPSSAIEGSPGQFHLLAFVCFKSGDLALVLSHANWLGPPTPVTVRRLFVIHWLLVLSAARYFTELAKLKRQVLRVTSRCALLLGWSSWRQLHFARWQP